MTRRIRSLAARACRYAMAGALLLGMPCFAFAQTLSEPAPPAKWSSPSKTAKSQAARAKACTAFGPGFVNVPGTDACVKIGGWVTVEGSARH